jgi:hypothetical protein
VSIREELILKVLAKEDSVVELAEQYGVSRKTIYKWLARYESKGFGPPFASTRALGGLTALSAWWVSLGIRVVRSRPGRPTDNGRTSACTSICALTSKTAPRRIWLRSSVRVMTGRRRSTMCVRTRRSSSARPPRCIESARAADATNHRRFPRWMPHRARQRARQHPCGRLESICESCGLPLHGRSGVPRARGPRLVLRCAPRSIRPSHAAVREPIASASSGNRSNGRSAGFTDLRHQPWGALRLPARRRCGPFALADRPGLAVTNSTPR